MARSATGERERQKQWKRVKMRGRWNEDLRQAGLEPFKNISKKMPERQQ